MYFEQNEKFENWTLTLGDGIYACSGFSVSDRDIGVYQRRHLTELRCNMRRLPIQAHAIYYKKITQTPSSMYFKFLWRIPYRPRARFQRYNPQTLECAIMYYDASTTTRYCVALQWVVNPWINNELRKWENETWVKYADKKADILWHTVELYADWVNKTGWVKMDSYKAEISSISSKTIDWGTTSFVLAQIETINCTPNCNRKRGFSHRAWFRNYVIILC